MLSRESAPTSQENTTRDLASELGETLGLLKVLHDFEELGFGLLAAVDVLQSETSQLQIIEQTSLLLTLKLVPRPEVSLGSGAATGEKGVVCGAPARRMPLESRRRERRDKLRGNQDQLEFLNLSCNHSQQERVEGRDEEEANGSEGDGAFGLLHHDPDRLGAGRRGGSRTKGRGPRAEASLRDDLGLSSLSSTGGTREEGRDEGGGGESGLGNCC